MELLYGNITLIRRLMNDGPSSVRVPRLNLIRALNLPGREHDGIPVRATETVGRRGNGGIAIREGKRVAGAEGERSKGKGERNGKSSDRTAVRTRRSGRERLFALRTTEQIRHADDDVDDSSRTDCHANHGTERPVIDSRARPASSLAIRAPIRQTEVERKAVVGRVAAWRFSVGASVAGNYTEPSQ